MKPETKGQQIRGALVAMGFTVAALPFIVLWAAASWVDQAIRDLCRNDSKKMKGG